MVQGGGHSDRFAQAEDEAERRYKRYRSIDPFPSIEAALLNTADLDDYVAATGMICPFEPMAMKPASCGIKIGGKCIYWDEKNTKQICVLTNDFVPGYDGLERKSTLVLRPNSITYVPVKPTFRLPEYIAMRFNLTIQNVYRGLLLGTGPLVDPGFHGKLWFPLHNLTNDEYQLDADEVVIYTEFTKLSRWRAWASNPAQSPQRSGTYVPFDPEKLLHRTDIDEYLYYAAGGRPISSSVQTLVTGILTASEAAERAAVAANTAEASARDIAGTTRRRVNTAAVGTVVGVVFAGLLGVAATYIGIGQIVGTVFPLASDTRSELARFVGQFTTQLSKNEEAVSGLKTSLEADRAVTGQVEQRLRDISDELKQLSARIDTAADATVAREIAGIRHELDELRSRRPAAGRTKRLRPRQ